MDEKRYIVANNGNVLARGMTLDMSLIFIEAYCTKYFREYIHLDMQEEPSAVCSDQESA